MQKTAREPEKSGDLAVVLTAETKPVTVSTNTPTRATRLSSKFKEFVMNL